MPYTSPGARLFTPDRVQLLRALYRYGLTTISHLARECGTSHKTMRMLLKGESYADVPERAGCLHYFAGKEILGVKIPELACLMQQDSQEMK